MAQALHVPLLLLFSLAVVLPLDHAASSRSQQETAPGSVQKAQVNEEDVQQMVAFALRVFNAANNDQHLSRTVQVVSAQRQVGILWGSSDELALGALCLSTTLIIALQVHPKLQLDPSFPPSPRPC